MQLPCHDLAMRHGHYRRLGDPLPFALTLSIHHSMPAFLLPCPLPSSILISYIVLLRPIPSLLLSPSSCSCPFFFFDYVLLKTFRGRFLIISLLVTPWNSKHGNSRSFDADCGIWSMVNVATISLSSVILKRQYSSVIGPSATA